jgi:regulator of sigma E protease
MGILLTLLVLTLVVLVHEYGHYATMRRNGVHVIEFTVGFGPTLWERKLKSGTVFRLKPILLGGYARPVSKAGLSDEEAAKLEGAIEDASAWAKFKIYMAGMFYNATAAFITFAAVSYATGTIPGFTVPFLKPLHLPHLLVPLAAALIASYGLWLATPLLLGKLFASGIKGILANVAGPVGIVTMGNDMVAASPTPGVMLLNAVMFFAFINIGLAGFNLLPLMPLDGGRVVDLLLEKLGGRLGTTLRRGFQLVSVALFLGLIILAFAGDFLSLAGIVKR